MSTGRLQPAGAAVNGKIYVIGGRNPYSGVLDVVEEYDPATDTWTTKAPMATDRYNSRAVAVNNKIYVIGGLDYSGALAVVEEYDPLSDTWTTKTPMPIVRYAFGAAEYNNKIYVIGGVRASGGITNSIEEYDPATDTWSEKTPLPTTASNLDCVAYSGIIYAFTQFNVYAYDPANDTSTTKTRIPLAPEATYGPAVAVIGDKIWVMGDYNINIYHPTGDYWTLYTTKPYRTQYALVNDGNMHLYMMGGVHAVDSDLPSGSLYKQNEVFDRSGSILRPKIYYIHRKD